MVLSPLIALAVASVVIMLGISVQRGHRVTFLITLAGLGSSFGMLVRVYRIYGLADRQVTRLMLVDDFAIFYLGLILIAACIIVVLSFEYLKQRAGDNEEYYLLLLVAVLGAMTIVVSSHFASFFLGLELLSVSLYTMVAYLDGRDAGIEAGIKYLVLASVSAAFLLFGIALVYAATGTMHIGTLASLAAALPMQAGGVNPLILAGFGLIIAGLGFKLALVPFHLWTPDVYEGAPAPVTAFIATVSKGAVLVFLIRFGASMKIQENPSLFAVFSLLAVLSMFTGNLLALFQKNIKRLLAYSSIAHIGYLLVPFMAGGRIGLSATAYYLAAYFVTTLGAFGVVTLLSGKGREADRIDDYRGLAIRHPWLAGSLTAMLFSLAGMPVTAGFIAKFYIIAAGADSSLWWLVMALVINSALGLFYYLRVVAAIYTQEKEAHGAQTKKYTLSLSGAVILSVLTVLLICFGVYPPLLIGVIEKTVLRLI